MAKITTRSAKRIKRIRDRAIPKLKLTATAERVPPEAHRDFDHIVDLPEPVVMAEPVRPLPLPKESLFAKLARILTGR